MAMMSTNAVLMKFFKLPPAMRMVLALAGFGSLASIVFMLLPALRTREGKIWVLIIGGIGLALFLLIWGVRRLFFRKKSSQLSEALDSQGPTRGDVAEQEQIYRQKFRAKLADLKTNGLSVYKLPWFVLMGEPGCGKTASLIHSGLDFPLGKDEVPGFGGTRNYNWWFTNEAVILDTAGRIAFQEEGTTDKVEWEYFLKLLKAHRPRCPVNGLILALPADKLLRDNSEERAQKATILRERLRQVHQALGVRFPTFVLITKMDLVGGFSEFFEEIRVDLQQRNQMCGWSRAGEFQEPYDPKEFPDAFNQVYHRLRDWSMRYLQRKATEEELGMIVTFPEAFRQLRDPLHDYVATIFQKSPLLEPPFFRGFYFTSAVQEGAPIFDVFSRSKAGITIAERPTRAVDSKAFFIHDFYDRKVFPEHGLVFRSARHVSLNQRMRRLVWVGSAAMLVLMVTIFGFGLSGTHELIDAPRDTCTTAGEAIAKGNIEYEAVPANLRTAKSLRGYYDDYSAPWTQLYARLLFVGANIRVPQGYVGEIHARFVLDCILKPILTKVESELAGADVPPITQPQQRARYLEALRVYTKWYGEVVGQHRLTALDGQEAVLRRTEFEALLSFLDWPDADRDDAAEQFEAALGLLARESRSFAREILRDSIGFDRDASTATVVAAIKRIADSWMPVTRLAADNTNQNVKYWAEFSDRVSALRERYGEILALAGDFADEAGFEEAVARYLRLTEGAEHMGDPDFTNPQPGTLHEAYYNLMAFLQSTPVPQTDEHRIIRLGELLALFQEQWNAEFGALRAALESGAPNRGGEPQARVYQALDQGQTDLVTAFERSLDAIRTRLGLDPGIEPLAYYAEQNLIEIEEANPPTPRTELAQIRLARTALGLNGLLKTYLIELRELVSGAEDELKALEDLRKWPGLLERLTAAQPAGKFLSMWFSGVEGPPGDALADLIRKNSGLKDHRFWRPVDLFELATRMWTARRGSSAEFLLARMAERATATTQVAQMPGLARLIPGFDQPSGLPFDRHRFNTAAPAAEVRAAPAEPKPEEPEEEPGEGRIGRLRRGPRAAEPAAEEPAARLEREESTALLHDYHTRVFLVDSLRQFERVKTALQAQPGGSRVVDSLARAADGYIVAYFNDWYEIYADPSRLLDEGTLAFIERCARREIAWPEYVAALEQEENDFARALADRMQALIHEVVMFADDLGDNAVDNAVFDRIEGRLGELARQNRSIPHREVAMTNPRNAPDLNQGDPGVVYSRQLVEAWGNYVREVRALGPLTAADQRSSGQTPNLDRLAETIVYKQATTPRHPLIAPLIDIADYGQKLLVHHLDRKLADLFAQHRGEYPLIQDGRDDTALLTRISALNTIDPTAFLAVLREVAEFQIRYQELYQDVQPDAAVHRTLHLCEAWTRFLYDDPSGLRRDNPPLPLDVGLAIVRDPSGTVANAARVYSTLTVTLPLLSTSLTAAGKVEVTTLAGEEILGGSVQQAIGTQPPQYRWSLLPGAGVAFDRMTAIVSDKHPDALAEYPPRAGGWTLPGDPWSLLMAMGARDDNRLGDGYWKIPVRIETDVNPIGFLIGIKIGSRERPFPGVIPPLPDPGALPDMAKAADYLRG